VLIKTLLNCQLDNAMSYDGVMGIAMHRIEDLSVFFLLHLFFYSIPSTLLRWMDWSHIAGIAINWYTR